MHASELCKRHAIPLSDQGLELCTPDLSHRQFFDRLLEAGCLADARRFLAHVLGRRRSLRWAVECARAALGEAGLLAEVEQYLEHSSEERRLLLRDRGLAEAPEGPLGYLALAAFFSGGTVSLPEQPFVPPAGNVTARLVGVSVYMSSVWAGAEPYRRRSLEFLAGGVRLASTCERHEVAMPELLQWQT